MNSVGSKERESHRLAWLLEVFVDLKKKKERKKRRACNGEAE